jgi:anti-sigma-K factor RskA
MNLIKNTDLLNHLASNYALGTLRGGARRRFETLAREQAPVRAAALIWQTRLASMNELQPQSVPGAAVWTRIDNLVQGEQQAKSMQATRESARPEDPPGLNGWIRSLLLWRGAAAAGALATAFVVVTGLNLRDQMGGEIQQLQAKLLATPQIDYVAVLADDKSAASMLVTFDPKNNKLTLQRVGGYQEASDRSLQLWALPPSGGPKSLGVLGRDKLLRLTAGESDVREIPTLAISLEPKGGVPSAGGPTGPVLFSGALIQKML